MNRKDNAERHPNNMSSRCVTNIEDGRHFRFSSEPIAKIKHSKIIKPIQENANKHRLVISRLLTTILSNELLLRM